MKKVKIKELPITEDLDFSYLLGLMRPLHNLDEYSWLPELFSIIGYERLIELCKYCGGESIRIPTLDELSRSLDSLQSFYDVCIKKTRELDDIPATSFDLVQKIKEVYDVREGQEIYQ